MGFYLVVAITILFILIVRLVMVLPSKKKRSTDSRNDKQQKKKLTNKVIRTCVVLGSGGHTSEMCTLIRSLDPNHYHFEFVVAKTDKKSEPFATSVLSEHLSNQLPLKFHSIPRSREVKQSYFTSVFTTLFAMLYTPFVILFRIYPDLVLVNGPGTCIPVCLACYIPRFLGIKFIKIIYVESAARVKSLSLTGKILYRLADRFIVQWKDLVQSYPRAEYIGRLC
jgi:beta-1,4-N-acetylglucosaminyltransferase